MRGRGVWRKEQLEKEKENIKSAFFSEFLHTHTPFILWSEITGKVLRNVFRSSYLKPNGRKKKISETIKHTSTERTAYFWLSYFHLRGGILVFNSLYLCQFPEPKEFHDSSS